MCWSAPTSVSENQSSVVVLGCFDGVHMGHRALIARAKDIARKRGLPLVAYSPESRKGQALLTTPAEKTALLHSLGCDSVILADFAAIKDLSPLAFLQKVLWGQLHCAFAVCGYNFAFGKKAAGDGKLLCDFMRSIGGNALVVPPVTFDEEPVSSTRIRALLTDGHPADAARLMGRPYTVTNVVCHGRAIGRTLGFPTLNLPFRDEKLIPKNGVYYCRVHTPMGLFGAVTNVGFRPTFADTPPDAVLEAHLLDFTGDLYDKEVSVEFLCFLRPECSFDSPQALAETVKGDIEKAIALKNQDPVLQKELKII
jgi:riboflavin kinase/FMN adenylyltransferase